ncbi:MAG: glutathione S-transferase family protein [Thermodesulfobacteriota bacterium]
MIKIYGSEISNNVNKVRFTANALGVEYELSPINLFEGQQYSEEFLKLNPVGKVPVMQDGDLTLFESMAISKYLSDKQGSSIYPQDLHQRAIVDQWIDFCDIHVQAALNRVIFNRLIAPQVGAEVDQNSLNFGLEMLDKYFPILDAQLGQSEYLAGSELTLADINLVAILDPAEVSSVDFSAHQNLQGWFQKMKQQDFYTKCHNDYKETMSASA